MCAKRLRNSNHQGRTCDKISSRYATHLWLLPQPSRCVVEQQRRDLNVKSNSQFIMRRETVNGI